jgi:uncharacterized membrane protein YdjX (TVP38/TMEM64 family)
MTQHSDVDSARVKLALASLAVLLGALVFAAASGYLGPLVAHIGEIFRGKEQLRAYVESWGPWAPAVFIGLQVLQVVVAPIPGELTGAVGGFIFGAVPNVLYSTIGLSLGSLMAFGAARLVGYPLVQYVVPREYMERFQFLIQRRGFTMALIFFITPGFPKDILCYMLGLSPMGFVPFAVVSALGRIPGTALLSLSGSAIYDENWGMLAVLTVLCVVGVGLIFKFRDRIERRFAGTVPAEEVR